MYTLEFLIYHFRAFGFGQHEELPDKLTVEETSEKINNQDPQWSFTSATASKLVEESDVGWKRE